MHSRTATNNISDQASCSWVTKLLNQNEQYETLLLLNLKVESVSAAVDYPASAASMPRDISNAACNYSFHFDNICFWITVLNATNK